MPSSGVVVRRLGTVLAGPRISRFRCLVQGGLPAAALHLPWTPSQRGRIRAPWHRPVRNEGSGFGMASFKICIAASAAIGGIAALIGLSVSAYAGASNAPLQGAHQKAWAEEVSEAIRRGKPGSPTGPASTGTAAPSPGRDSTRSNPRGSGSTQGGDAFGDSGRGASSQGPSDGGAGQSQGGGRGQQGDSPGSGNQGQGTPGNGQGGGQGNGQGNGNEGRSGKD
jgi:hypothetical protein